MTQVEAIDARLHGLLAAKPRVPDEIFVAKVERALLADRRLAAARSAAWQRFAVEAAASVAVVLAFILLARFAAPLEAGAPLPLLGPATAALMLAALWLTVGLRPTAAR